MNTQKDNTKSFFSSPRTAALTAGVGLLVMTILAAYANFGILPNLIIPEDALLTAENIITSSGSFLTAVICFLIVAILDVVVAWALYTILKSANKPLSLVAAWLRTIYAVIFAISLTYLYKVYQLLTSPGSSQNKDAFSQAMNGIDSFQKGWDIGLIIFGIHLLLIAFISLRFGTIPKWLGVLLAIAWLGYLIDSIGIIVSPTFSLYIGEYTFVGELILIFWLLWKGIKGFPKEQTDN